MNQLMRCHSSFYNKLFCGKYLKKLINFVEIHRPNKFFLNIELDLTIQMSDPQTGNCKKSEYY